MARLHVVMAGGRYDRTRSLMDGSVRPEGLDFEYIEMPVEEVLRRVMRNAEFDVAECSLAHHLIATAQGGWDYLAIPLFPSRCFRHSFVFVNRNAGIAGPRDLRGKLVGVRDYAMTAAVWLRGLLEHDYGVPPSAMRWRTGAVEQPGGEDQSATDVGKEVEILPVQPHKSLNAMLETGEIHALMTPRIPSAFLNRHPDVVRLFPDYKAEERKYYERMKLVPIMHTVVIKRSLYEREPWVAPSLVEAFRRSTLRWREMMLDVNALPCSLPWYLPALEETLEVFGSDFWPEGFSANWRTVETLVRYAKEQGLIDRMLEPSELFAPNTLAD